MAGYFGATQAKADGLSSSCFAQDPGAGWVAMSRSSVHGRECLGACGRSRHA